MEFTTLEKAVLDWFATRSNVDGLASQIAVCQAQHRELTGVGSFTTLELHQGAPRVDPVLHDGPVEGPIIEETKAIPLGGGSLLWLDEGGFIDMLEIYAFGDQFDGSIAEFALRDRIARTDAMPVPTAGSSPGGSDSR